MPRTRLPSLSEWDGTDWDEAREMGFLSPRFDFVTAEDMTKERDHGRDRLGQAQGTDTR